MIPQNYVTPYIGKGNFCLAERDKLRGTPKGATQILNSDLGAWRHCAFDPFRQPWYIMTPAETLVPIVLSR
jgi:hypothetical protein